MMHSPSCFRLARSRCVGRRVMILDVLLTDEANCKVFALTLCLHVDVDCAINGLAGGEGDSILRELQGQVDPTLVRMAYHDISKSVHSTRLSLDYINKFIYIYWGY